MKAVFSTLFDGNAARFRAKVIGIYILLIGANVAVWVWALMAFHNYPILLGTASLAYSFGLRHAFDADHIAAIDNVTRKLIQARGGSVGVGLFFSLGHSTIVVLASVALAAMMAFKSDINALLTVGGVIGTMVSALFLLTIAIANIFILHSVWCAFQRVQRGAALAQEDLHTLLAGRGFIVRIFRSLFRLIGRPWHMYPLGFLFGLGFDTATEVALLGISAAEAAKGMSLWSILVFSALFSAGMTLMDTTNSILMVGAYGWAFMTPVRKLYYNLTITFVSVIVALFVGGLEALGLVSDQLDLKGWFWSGISDVNNNFGTLGYIIVGLFVLIWMVSTVIYRLKRYDDLPVSS